MASQDKGGYLSSDMSRLVTYIGHDKDVVCALSGSQVYAPLARSTMEQLDGSIKLLQEYGYEVVLTDEPTVQEIVNASRRPK